MTYYDHTASGVHKTAPQPSMADLMREYGLTVMYHRGRDRFESTDGLAIGVCGVGDTPEAAVAACVAKIRGER